MFDGSDVATVLVALLGLLGLLFTGLTTLAVAIYTARQSKQANDAVNHSGNGPRLYDIVDDTREQVTELRRRVDRDSDRIGEMTRNCEQRTRAIDRVMRRNAKLDAAREDKDNHG